MSSDEMSDLLSRTFQIRKKLDQLAESTTVALSRADDFDTRIEGSIHLFASVVRKLEIAIDLWDQSREAIVVAESLLPRLDVLTKDVVESADQIKKSHSVVKTSLSAMEERLSFLEEVSVSTEKQLREIPRAVSTSSSKINGLTSRVATVEKDLGALIELTISLGLSIEGLTSRVATVEANVSALTEIVKLPVRKRR